MTHPILEPPPVPEPKEPEARNEWTGADADNIAAGGGIR